MGALPPEPGFACVVVTHQHPNAVTLLPELLRRNARCPVVKLEAGTRLRPKTVYVTPPGAVATLQGNLVQFGDAPADSRPIDAFFRSLAQEKAENAIAVILSGTGTDGTRGAVDVKTAGGLVFAQETRSAKFPGMPTSALAAGAVDAELPAARMPAEIQKHVSRRSTEVQELRREEASRALGRIISAMCSRTGHDFSGYKMSTLLRRIDRRMAVRRFGAIRDYARYVDETPTELDVLFREVLISVTCFFRDEDAFECFTGELRRAIQERTDDERPFRIWVSACATGEEAYSIAITVRELAMELGKTVSVQIFATDLDSHAIEVARAGRYPLSIAEHVSAARLERYFVKTESDYRINREIRELVVFAVQNVIKDPPFTKLDVLTCRNLLIYLEPDLQRRVLGLFSHALVPGGVLFLGSSETLGRFDEAFETVEKKHKVFRRRETQPEHMPDFADLPRAHIERSLPGRTPPQSHPALAQVAERVLLSHLVPPSVLVNQRGDIAYFHGRTGQFLEPPTGEPIANLFNMVREGLRLELPAAVRQAATSKDPIVRAGLQVKSNGGFIGVRLTVRRLDGPELVRNSFIVSFEVEPPIPAKGRNRKGKGGHGATEGRVSELEVELQHTRENLQGTIEELETSNEELKSTNEELQSTNEELQSANEELETSREEMQSLNEELQTVNSELEERNRALSQANDDMQNLLNSTDIATVFLDGKLAIKRFTTPARKVFSLIDTDIGRPISDLTANLLYDGLVEDAREVLTTLVFREREIQTKEGAWRLMRIMPYRTAENVIDGLVITFVDIDRVRREQRAAEEDRRFSNDIVDALPDAVAVLDAELRFLRANQAFFTLFNTTPKRLLGESANQALNGPWRTSALHDHLARMLSNGQPIRTTIDPIVNGEHDAIHVSIRRFLSSSSETRVLLVAGVPDGTDSAASGG